MDASTTNETVRVLLKQLEAQRKRIEELEERQKRYRETVVSEKSKKKKEEKEDPAVTAVKRPPHCKACGKPRKGHDHSACPKKKASTDNKSD